MKKKIIVFSITTLLFVALGIFFGVQRITPSAAGQSAVNTLLAASLPDTHGQAQKLSQWKEKALIVNFWATWCAPCVEEMPELSALQKEVAPRDIQILGIGIDSAVNIGKFAEKYQISYPLLVAGVGGVELSRQFGNQAGGLPFTVLIGKDGIVKKTYLGRLKMDQLRQDLKAI
ncbi:MAG TPA: TlpA disulfide reductase family protein [Noviherbaspirillum sp.]|nr:TlpA disulfide reductase family protein [Noviherbaspirillum sp.]